MPAQCPNPGREHEATTAFILRLTWDSVSRKWIILLKPVDGGTPRLFTDVESTFLHVAGLCTETR